MRIMGLDVGEKTIGVAISDELGWTAQGIETIQRESRKKDYLRIEELIKQYDVGEIIVGLPKNMNGTIGPRGEMCQVFAEYLHNRSRLPVKLWDERLTTMAAEKVLLSADVSRKKRKQVIDKMAAVMILQNYLDAQK
ncbi:MULTISPECIES: Holliday junction resolvase RuvX [Aneurinibacillus]|uniref:Putative pre-16S rRNA nuclease n=1 Tax=Aneurinibacillus thermoaerophilus TaxID=143495 RepID=A0A1G7YC89_ANETH|nr:MULTISPECIES: Holliday junction resolvase RuvX [Aneurinibacillus]AMA74606.1 crossover junction endodeoxyribonuclease RuvA [Aneurinibacillus sp. XH2]MED0676470.1 Holliday junction resolvase RuvX [Aneurinibacillus thermoaerophilus]MED0678982.1 Holliday junction resolvase RuvX [Aneurinibacillus thermoaerophilus]MED0736519.1 Holliday junction resolvase RuvX [Aneurinibacillus thermoaerophilus]MED0756022.1 Holliday junction resolvase RuvX [Aneurinibacillus thermoaerophilus]